MTYPLVVEENEGAVSKGCIALALPFGAEYLCKIHLRLEFSSPFSRLPTQMSIKEVLVSENGAKVRVKSGEWQIRWL